MPVDLFCFNTATLSAVLTPALPSNGGDAEDWAGWAASGEAGEAGDAALALDSLIVVKQTEARNEQNRRQLLGFVYVRTCAVSMM